MATQTKVEVRVVAAGGKFLGGDIGGAEVVIRDALDGQVLARGTVRGESGDTAAIMEQPHLWGTPLPTDDDASKFVATLSLDEPRLVTVTAYGPLAALASARKATAEQWVIPGQDLCGERAVVMVMPGLIVQVLQPATHTQVTEPTEVQIMANVGMMCGCPIEPTGPWVVADFSVQAFVEALGNDGATPVATVPLAYAGTPSHFQGSWQLSSQGFYQITVVAMQLSSPNTGLDRATVFWLPSSTA